MLLIYDFILLELLIVLASIGYIVFHFSHSGFSGLKDRLLNNKEKLLKLRKQEAKRKRVIREIEKEQQAEGAAIEKEAQKKVRLTTDQKDDLSKSIKKAQAKISVREFEQAKSSIVEGLIIDKHNIELNCLLASIYERDGDLSRAEIIYKDLILEHDPKKPDIYILLGNNLLEQGKEKIAYEIYKKGLEKAKSDEELLSRLTQLGYDLLDYEGARTYAKKLTTLNEKNIFALEYLAQSNLQLGNDQRAYDIFVELKRLDPYNPTVRKWVETLEQKLGIHPETNKMRTG